MEIVLKEEPRLVLIVGPCRTGTTALANVFTRAGVPAHMQPIKSMRRAKASGNKLDPWVIDEKKIIVSKETIGPETPAEFFDPVKILLESGFPKEKIVLIPTIREPDQTYDSWKRMWGEVDLEKFIQSFELTCKIKDNARSLGIKTVPYVYEMIKYYPAIIIVQRLFSKARIYENVKQASRVTKNWGDLKKNPNAVFYDKPPRKFIDGIEKRGGYVYKEYENVLHLDNKKLDEIYKNFRESCRLVLQLVKAY